MRQLQGLMPPQLFIMQLPEHARIPKLMILPGDHQI